MEIQPGEADKEDLPRSQSWEPERRTEPMTAAKSQARPREKRAAKRERSASQGDREEVKKHALQIEALAEPVDTPMQVVLPQDDELIARNLAQQALRNARDTMAADSQRSLRAAQILATMRYGSPPRSSGSKSR